MAPSLHLTAVSGACSGHEVRVGKVGWGGRCVAAFARRSTCVSQHNAFYVPFSGNERRADNDSRACMRDECILACA